MSKCDSFEPLSAREVTTTAKTLEDLARRFEAEDKPREVANAWQDELNKLYMRGDTSVQKVFAQMQNDSQASTDPKFPQLSLSFAKAPLDGGVETKLDVSPPKGTDAIFPMLSASIDNNMVFSDAALAQYDSHSHGTYTGRTKLFRRACWEEK